MNAPETFPVVRNAEKLAHIAKRSKVSRPVPATTRDLGAAI
jgi:hypothetical protein